MHADDDACCSCDPNAIRLESRQKFHDWLLDSPQVSESLEFSEYRVFVVWSTTKQLLTGVQSSRH